MNLGISRQIALNKFFWFLKFYLKVKKFLTQAFFWKTYKNWIYNVSTICYSNKKYNILEIFDHKHYFLSKITQKCVFDHLLVILYKSWHNQLRYKNCIKEIMATCFFSNVLLVVLLNINFYIFY